MCGDRGSEPGCLLHSVHHDVEDPNRLVFIEHWADRAALDTHFRVPASGTFVQALRPARRRTTDHRDLRRPATRLLNARGSAHDRHDDLRQGGSIDARRCRSKRSASRSRAPNASSAPVRAEPWSGTLDATEFGPASLQPPGEVFMAVDMPLSEDCLSLNVWAPEAAVGNTRGPARDGVDPRRRVPARLGRAHAVARPGARGAGDVVVVTVNYRLGALGFLTHPDLADANGVCGNWGVLDLVAALQWVRDEIGAFGGDAGERHAVR